MSLAIKKLRNWLAVVTVLFGPVYPGSMAQNRPDSPVRK